MEELHILTNYPRLKSMEELHILTRYPGLRSMEGRGLVEASNALLMLIHVTT